MIDGLGMASGGGESIQHQKAVLEGTVIQAPAWQRATSVRAVRDGSSASECLQSLPALIRCLKVTSCGGAPAVAQEHGKRVPTTHCLASE